MNWLSWKIACPATAFTQRSGPTGMPSPAASLASCRASYASTQSAPSCAMKRCECGAQSRVRSPTAARRRGLPTGAARRRARVATLIGVSWPPGGEDSEGRRLDVPGAASIARSWRPTSRRKGLALRPGRRGSAGLGRDRRPRRARSGRPGGRVRALRAALARRRRSARAPRRGRYLSAASSLVEGEGLDASRPGLRVRAAPAAGARRDPARRGSVDAAYDWFKAANAFFFALHGDTRVPPRPPARFPSGGRWWRRPWPSRSPRPSPWPP